MEFKTIIIVLKLISNRFAGFKTIIIVLKSIAVIKFKTIIIVLFCPFYCFKFKGEGGGVPLFRLEITNE